MIRKINLPLSLANDTIANKIAHYVSKLGPNSGFYSAILFQKNNQYYFLEKDQGFPYIPFDWSIYNLMRISAKTIITSGECFRKEKHIYGSTRGTFNRQEIVEIYECNPDRGRYNLIVYSKKMLNQQIKSIIDQNYFQLIPLSQILPHSNEQSFKQLAQRVNHLGLGPTIYENGQTTLGKALEQVKPEEANFTQLIILSLFEGEMPQKYIGSKYSMSILQRDFNKVWQSEKIKSISKEKEQKNIYLHFVVYERKNKPMEK